MRVLCIKSGSSSNKNVILPKRGSIYNITKIVKDEYLKECGTNIWYELLETGNYLHIGTKFVLAPVEEENEPTSISNKGLNKAMLN